MKEILPCVGCVGIVESKLDRSCIGVHSSVVELTSLAILPFHCLGSLINPTVACLGWTFVCIWLCVNHYLSSLINPIVDWIDWTLVCMWLCVGHVVPYLLVEIMPNSGVAVVLRDWWKQLAYGWVECCSNIASCSGHLIFKISILLY